MRILLFTGKGGVGKSTIAAGTAALTARSGRRTLVLSTDTAHSLCDALCVPSASSVPGPTEVATNLWVHQVDAQSRFERSWADVQRYLLSVLDAAGVDPISAQELTVLPGAEEALALLELRELAHGSWDAIVVDCAPTAETLRLLALPEALNWYMDRVLPAERRIVRVLKPVLTKAAGVPMPGDGVFDALERLHGELAEVRALLTSPQASVRLVMTPEDVVLAEARRAWTSLSLYGYATDGVIANRVFPEAGADPWRATWVEAQRRVLTAAEESFAGLRVWQASYAPVEPRGIDALASMAQELYGDSDPLAVPPLDSSLRVEHTVSGPVLTLALPGASAGDVDLTRHLTQHGDELAVTVGPYRRLVSLPGQLSGHPVMGARVSGGKLQVRFASELGPVEEGDAR